MHRAPVSGMEEYVCCAPTNWLHVTCALCNVHRTHVRPKITQTRRKHLRYLFTVPIQMATITRERNGRPVPTPHAFKPPPTVQLRVRGVYLSRQKSCAKHDNPQPCECVCVPIKFNFPCFSALQNYQPAYTVKPISDNSQANCERSFVCIAGCCASSVFIHEFFQKFHASPK